MEKASGDDLGAFTGTLGERGALQGMLLFRDILAVATVSALAKDPEDLINHLGWVHDRESNGSHSLGANIQSHLSSVASSFQPRLNRRPREPMPTAMKTKSLQAQADALVRKLEQERSGRNLMLGKVVKTQATTPVVLNSAPELQIAFVELVVDIYARMGTPKGKRMTEWFRKGSVPSASAEVVCLLLRRRLPFSDADAGGMLEKMSKVSYLSLVEFNDQLAGAVVKHSAEHGLSPRLRKAAKRFADVLAVRHLPPAQAEYWKDEYGFPRAKDRKIATKIDHMLTAVSLWLF
jgi:hypothetical protein